MSPSGCPIIEHACLNSLTPGAKMRPVLFVFARTQPEVEADLFALVGAFENLEVDERASDRLWR